VPDQPAETAAARSRRLFPPSGEKTFSSELSAISGGMYRLQDAVSEIRPARRLAGVADRLTDAMPEANRDLLAWA
jgi:hypothetical protein